MVNNNNNITESLSSLSQSHSSSSKSINTRTRKRRFRVAAVVDPLIYPTIIIQFLLFLFLCDKKNSFASSSSPSLALNNYKMKEMPILKELFFKHDNRNWRYQKQMITSAASSSSIPFFFVHHNAKQNKRITRRQQQQQQQRCQYCYSYHHNNLYPNPCSYKDKEMYLKLQMSYSTTTASVSSHDENKRQNITSASTLDEEDGEDEENDGMDEEELTSLTNGEEEENDDEEESTTTASSILSTLPEGTPKGFYIISQYTTPSHGFTNLSHHYTTADITRLELSPENVTLPVALTLLNPNEYPALSRARKACRKGAILIHRGPLGRDETTGEEVVFDPEKCIRGRVGDRVYPQDVIGKQVRMGNGFYPTMSYLKPPFELPVVYEDDHFAIVNKPAGVVVYSHRKGGHGRMTVRAALPFVLRPPSIGTMSIIRRPQAVHRLDKPTSGLLLIAKTKPAMVDLTRQFVERNIKKTYTAIVNGIPDEPTDTSISSLEAHDMGVDIGIPDDNDSEEEDTKWQIIDYTLEEKSAVTVWRPLRYSKSLKGTDNYVTLVELKPKTGRFHQLRRHMAWVCETPVIGDSEYDHRNFKDESLYLCSNKVTLDHPYYNTEEGRKEWDAMEEEDEKKYGNGMIRLSDDEDDNGRRKVQVHAFIELPEKFMKFLDRSEERAKKFLDIED